MTKIAYQGHIFRKQARLIIDKANCIIAEYQAAGYALTLRQLYYQFVARGIIRNTQKDYDKLGVIISDARLSGLLDWEAIIDRTRTVEGNNHFKDPGDILTVAAETYKLDTRTDQNVYIEVWVEKEALLGVIEPICRQLDVTYLACRGYYSQSAMWEAAQRISAAQQDGKKAVILHLGDHDPSGLDMTRDIQTRLRMFGEGGLAGFAQGIYDWQFLESIVGDLLGDNAKFQDADNAKFQDMVSDGVKVNRIALNIDQVEKYKPPPNPAKLTDTRAAEYISEYGPESWELDALDPKVITSLIEDAVGEYTDRDKQQAKFDEQESHKQRLAYIAEHWDKNG